MQNDLELKNKVFQSRMSAEDLRKFRAVAEHRGQTLSGLLNMWIAGAYRKLPKEAQ